MFKKAQYHDAVFNTCSFILLWKIPHKWFKTVRYHDAVYEISHFVLFRKYYIILHCLALSCIILHCLALSCIILHCLASSRIILHRLASSCIAWHCLASSCIILPCLSSSCIVLHCLAFLCHISHRSTAPQTNIGMITMQFSGSHGQSPRKPREMQQMLKIFLCQSLIFHKHSACIKIFL